jgi:signal transduction histidine kinase
MKTSYPRDIGIVAAIFIFLILFVALVNLYISTQLRKELVGYDRDKVISIAALTRSYLNSNIAKDQLYYLLKNLSRSFHLDHLIVSDTLGNKIFDSWAISPGFKVMGEWSDYTKDFQNRPGLDEIIQQKNNFLYLNPSPRLFIYLSLNPAYSVSFDQIFRWHVFYITMSLFFVGFLGIFLIRNLLMPMRYAARVAKELGVEMRREDFVSETFNEIFRKIKIKEDTLVEFSAFIAHEFRNSIGTITGLARLAEKGKKPAADIIRECRSMEELINRLLEYSKPLKPMVIPLRLDSLIDETLERLHVPERIMIRKEIDPQLTMVKGDYDLLQNGLVNILKNSIEAIDRDGVIEIKTGMEDTGPFIAIQDSGCGLDQHELESIFSPFYSKKEQGMGLGLAYVKKVMELHNIRIEVKSQKGKGTKFIIRFPTA